MADAGEEHPQSVAGGGGGDRPTSGTAATTVALRPIGTAMPLGLLSLAVATFVYAGLQLGWISTTGQQTTVGVLLMVFPVPLQLTGSLLAFLSRDGATGTGLGILGVSWLSIGAVLVVGSPSGALGLLLPAAGVALMLSSAATALSKVVPALVLSVAGVRFALGGVYELGGGGWQDASAALGLGLAALAAYAAWAMELEDASGRALLPLGRRAMGAEAMSGPLDEQVAGVEHEAGVRRHL